MGILPVKKGMCQACKYFLPKGAKPDGYCILHKIADISKSNSCEKFAEKTPPKTKNFTQRALKELKK